MLMSSGGILELTGSVPQVAPTSSKQHPVNVGVNASATPFQQAGGYGSHGYSTGKAPKQCARLGENSTRLSPTSDALC